jgi:hypothetical protein
MQNEEGRLQNAKDKGRRLNANCLRPIANRRSPDDLLNGAGRR